MCVSKLILRVFLWKEKSFATLPSIPSVLFNNGFTYGYVPKESRNGEECGRPIKSKCQFNEIWGNVCKIIRGQIRCGKGRTGIIKALEELQRSKKKKKRKETVLFEQEKIDSSFKEYSYEDITYEEYSSEENHHREEGASDGRGGKGLKVEEGQKLSQKQLQMLETAAEEKLEASTNPLCKNQNLFRFLFEKVRKHEQKIDLQESPINSDKHVWHFKDALQRKTAGAKRKGRKVCLLLFLAYNRCSLSHHMQHGHRCNNSRCRFSFWEYQSRNKQQFHHPRFSGELFD